jgi:hypothetical protein
VNALLEYNKLSFFKGFYVLITLENSVNCVWCKTMTDLKGLFIIFGRIFGWILIFLATFTASGEAVVALTTGSYNGLATADVWGILVGSYPKIEAVMWYEVLLNQIMDWPAWVVMAPAGLFLSV